jgi:hypothetical protein
LNKRNLIAKRAVAAGIYDPTTPASNDRSNLFNLRVPTAITNEFLKTWKYSQADIDRIRKQEAKVEKFTKFINTMPLVFRSSLQQFNQGKANGWRSKTAQEVTADRTMSKALVAAFNAQ